MAQSGSHSVDTTGAMLQTPTAMADWVVIMPIVLFMMGGALTLMLRRRTDWHPHIAITTFIAVLAVEFNLLARVMDQGTLVMTMGNWLPPFGIAFAVDRLGAFFAFAGAFVGLAATIYGLQEFNTRERRYGFYPMLMLLMAGVTGSFLTGDIFNLYVWFEVMLISSFGLIVLGGSKLQLDGAVKYAFLNFIATTIFLIATGYLYGLVGTLNMADIRISLAKVDDAAPLATIFALYLLGFAMKAAAVPMHFWLPASYHTPRIVVSAIFAGLLTKVGVYALLRTFGMLFPNVPDLFRDIMIWIAVLTMIVGVLGALSQTDIRRVLGYLVVSGIGSMILGLGLGSQQALIGSVLYAIHSMLTMTALYLLAGIVNQMAGSFDTRKLGGLYRVSPLIAASFLVLVFAVSGLPPFSGFWPKAVLVEATLRQQEYLGTFAILLTGVLTTIAMGRVWAHAFWRGGPLWVADGEEDVSKIKVLEGKALWTRFAPVALLMVGICWLGFWPQPSFHLALEAAGSLVNPQAYIDSVLGGTR